LQFIEAIQMRDERKLKHNGFFVNSGTVERIGEKVQVVAAARPRKKKRSQPAEGEPGAAEKTAKTTKATGKNSKLAAAQKARLACMQHT
jgi:F0F1-type ATP synthase epsilon subunit